MTTPFIESDKDKCGYYVYGVVQGASVPPTEMQYIEGIDPAFPVHALPYRDIQAMVSEVSLVEFSQEALRTNVRDLEWLKAKVCIHENIVETISEHCAIVPMKFCTVFLDIDRVRETLAHYYCELSNTLRRLGGSREWGVKVYRDDEILASKVEVVSDKAKTLATQMAGKSSGAAYIWKKRLDGVVAAEVERISDECAQTSHDRLLDHAEDAAGNSLLGKDITGEEAEMTMNGGNWCHESTSRLSSRVRQIAEKRRPAGIPPTASRGPWPPYNFVTGSLAEGSRRS